MQNSDLWRKNIYKPSPCWKPNYTEFILLMVQKSGEPFDMVNRPLFTGFLLHPRWWLAGFLPSTVLPSWIIGHSYRGVWLCIAGLWYLMATSFWEMQYPMTLRVCSIHEYTPHPKKIDIDTQTWWVSELRILRDPFSTERCQIHPFQDSIDLQLLIFHCETWGLSIPTCIPNKKCWGGVWTKPCKQKIMFRQNQIIFTQILQSVFANLPRSLFLL